MGSLSLWHFAILGGVIWIGWRIFRSRREAHQRRELITLSVGEAEKLINEYGRILEKFTPTGTYFFDVRKLPSTKERIKAAIRLAFQHSPDSTQKEILKAAYLDLADFQPGIGEHGAGFVVAEHELQTKDRANLAQLISKRGDELNRWRPIVEAERKQLAAELDALRVD